MSTVPICYYGSSQPLPRRHTLRAGPLAVDYEQGDLRYVRLGEREVLRRCYVALRDRNWGTVPAQISEEAIEADPDRFRITYRVDNRQGDIDFAWTGVITGSAEGTITFRLDGLARSTFQRNRLGFCLLHPIRECAGARCRYEQGDGTIGEASFPRLIVADNPFHELRGFAHEIVPGLWAELRFDGDLFEMEDQRNWTDASFKTFCTPLRLPFPVTVPAGSRISQTVTLRLVGSPPHVVTPAATTPTLALQAIPLGRVPQIGLGAQDGHEPLSLRELQRLRLLRPAHLRIDLELANPDYPEQLRRETAHATALGIPLELALTVSERAATELAQLAEHMRRLRPAVCRVLLFHAKEWSTTPPWIRCARSALDAVLPGVPLFGGTTANFRELNVHRLPVSLLDGACYSVNPQVHAFDNASLVETCATLTDTVQTARAFCGDLPLAVTPITLRQRVNPYATGPALPVPPGQLPPRVDARQMSLFGAGWTVSSLKYLSESGVASVTYFETIGWRGVMESATGSPLPEQFPSRPGMVFPLFHVLADATELSEASVLGMPANLPLRCDGLALRSGTMTRVLVANLVGERTDVTVTGLENRIRIRMLDEQMFADATQDPERFRAEPGTAIEINAGRLELTLRPFAYARIDSE